MRCNCENSECPHGQTACQNPAGKRKAMYVGLLCDDCAGRMPKEYMVEAGTTKMTYGDLRKVILEELTCITESEACDECGMPMEGCSCESVAEVAPPGRERQVKKLKKVPGIDNPWAVAWSQHNKRAKPSRGK